MCVPCVPVPCLWRGDLMLASIKGNQKMSSGFHGPAEKKAHTAVSGRTGMYENHQHQNSNLPTSSPVPGLVSHKQTAKTLTTLCRPPPPLPPPLPLLILALGTTPPKTATAPGSAWGGTRSTASSTVSTTMCVPRVPAVSCGQSAFCVGPRQSTK